MRTLLAALGALLATMAAPAMAAVTYQVQINTAPAAGREALFDLQFVRPVDFSNNGGDANGDGTIDDADRAPADLLTAVVSDVVSDAVFLEAQADGDATFTLVPFTATFGNQGDFNAVLTRLNLGNFINFRLTLDGPLLNPGSLGATIFGISFLDAAGFDAGAFVPILTTDPSGAAGSLTVSSGAITTDTPNGPAGTPTVTFIPVGAGAVPEPATWAMMLAGFGLVGAGLRARRRVAVSIAA